MITISIFLAVAEKELYDCPRSEKRQKLDFLRSIDCNDSSDADACNSFYLRTCCAGHKEHDKKDPGLFKEELRCTELLCLCSKAYCCYDCISKKFIFSDKGLNKQTFEESGCRRMTKSRQVLDETVNVNSANRRFRTMNHCVAI